MILPSDITKPCKHGFIIDLTDGERRVQVRVFEFETQRMPGGAGNAEGGVRNAEWCEMPVSIDEGHAIARLRQAMECLRESVVGSRFSVLGSQLEAGAEGGKKTRQYFYAVPGCPAPSSNDVACVCWHDEGKGPMVAFEGKVFPNLEWRDKPAPSVDKIEVPVIGEGGMRSAEGGMPEIPNSEFHTPPLPILGDIECAELEGGIAP